VSATGLAFGLCVDLQRPWSEIRLIAEAADSAGWHSIYLPDHFMPHETRNRAAGGPVLESWTCLTGLAMVTRRIRIGTLVLGNTYRHPAVVANMAAALDQLSAGRLILGLGAGWQPNEHLAYGIGLPAMPERLDRLAEACAVIHALTRDRVATYQGRYYALVDAYCEPTPMQSALPILVGGGGERRTLPIAARYADAWHTWATSREFRRKSQILDQLCDAAGRPPTEVRRVCGASVTIISASEVCQLGADDEDILGPAAHVAEAIHRYRDAGAEEFVARDDARMPIGAALEFVRQVQQDIVPLLR
jgi:F420-dependent oxidoreductase-like protein